MLVPSLPLFSHFTVTKLPIKDGLCSMTDSLSQNRQGPSWRELTEVTCTSGICCQPTCNVVFWCSGKNRAINYWKQSVQSNIIALKNMLLDWSHLFSSAPTKLPTLQTICYQLKATNQTVLKWAINLSLQKWLPQIYRNWGIQIKSFQRNCSL